MEMKNNSYELKRRLADLFFPNRCPFCSRIIGAMDYICEGCAASFKADNRCEKFCGGRLFWVCEYNDKNRRIVYGAKNSRDGSKLGFMAYTLCACLAKYKAARDFDVIVPVPMYRGDKLKRGFSQSEKIAREMSMIIGVPTENAVVKLRRTKQQKQLSKTQRRDNLKNTFEVLSGMDIKGKRLLIIDDVTTTGATLAEMYEAVSKYGCKSADFAVFSKTAPKA